MNSKILVLVLLFVSSSLYANRYLKLLDEYHDDLCKILVNTSNSIDDYFVENNCTEESSTTRAELINSFAIESYQSLEKDIRLRLRLSLPKIQKNLRLIFEDETHDNTLYDSTKLTNELLQDKNYYLRLEYFKYIKKSLNMAISGGLRIRDGHLVPYLNLRSKYSLYNNEKLDSNLFNRFRYYTDGEIDNTFKFNNRYILNETINIYFKNQLSYSNRDDFETLINDLSWRKALSKKEEVETGFGVVSRLNNLKNPTLDYAHFHLLFHHLFYKDWIYYQVAPSILWRESNNFKISYRYMMNLGIIFSND